MSQINLPLVSIVTPVFNSASFIAETIESVINQSYSNWEMLIVDDCSFDNSVVIANSYALKDKRIRIFKLETNSGLPSVPRNYALNLASGKYIAFLDSDDVWLKEKLEKQVSFMENNDGIFLLYSRYLSKVNDKILDTLLPEERLMKRGYVFEELFLSDNFIPCLTVMMRNSDSNKYLFDENPDFKAIEDFDLWLKISKENKVDFLSEALAVYRIHRRNSSKGFVSFFIRLFKVINKWNKKVPFNIILLKYIYTIMLFFFLIYRKIISLLLEKRRKDER